MNRERAGQTISRRDFLSKGVLPLFALPFIAVACGKEEKEKLQPAGKIAFARLQGFGIYEIYKVNPDGSDLTHLVDIPSSIFLFSPDGKKIAYTSLESSGRLNIYAVNSDGTNLKNLTASYSLEEQLVTQPIWSPDSKRIAFSAYEPSRATNRDIFIINADGTNLIHLTKESGEELSPSWSPDGKRIAFGSINGISIINIDGSGLKQIVDNPGQAIFDGPYWSPDGKSILFTAGTKYEWDIYVVGTDGLGKKNLTNNPVGELSPSWFPDGKSILFDRSGNDGGFFVINRDGSGLKRLTNPDISVAFPSLSPDGKHILFSRIDTIRNSRVMVVEVDGSNVKEIGFGVFPQWVK